MGGLFAVQSLFSVEESGNFHGYRIIDLDKGRYPDIATTNLKKIEALWLLFCGFFSFCGAVLGGGWWCWPTRGKQKKNKVL
jgi:hypothetical protein